MEQMEAKAWNYCIVACNNDARKDRFVRKYYLGLQSSSGALLQRA
jgi:hypothetical protein